MTGSSAPARVLIVKTSSMGDVIHALPALTDASLQLPEVSFDWLVEEGFTDIPAAHPAVGRVLPVAVRRWRWSPLKTLFSGELGTLRTSLRDGAYDLVIDAQGLLKSAVLASLVPAPVCGFDRQSLREPLARFFYNNVVPVPRSLHAVERVRQLFAMALGYPVPITSPDYGLEKSRQKVNSRSTARRFILFIHGTTWLSKHWPERNWRELALKIGASGYDVVIPWGTSVERDRAMRIADQMEFVSVLPQMQLAQLMEVMGSAAGAFCVDTGLGHLATALGIPTMAFYGPTNPALTGNYGPGQMHHQNKELACVPCLRKQCPLLTRDISVQPCFKHDNVELLWIKLQSAIEGRGSASRETDDRK
jgi:heptosyltransferase-1